VLDQLQRATEQAVQQSAFAANERAREYLRSGVGRRLRVLHRTLSNMFELFPVETVQPLDRDDLDDAQINLHAFIMNLYGLFDNLAWAFVLHQCAARRSTKRLRLRVACWDDPPHPGGRAVIGPDMLPCRRPAAPRQAETPCDSPLCMSRRADPWAAAVAIRLSMRRGHP
jgi:hypothetical protein